MRFVLLALALLAWSGGPIMSPSPSPLPSPVRHAAAPAAPEEAGDVEALHALANSALERLRAAQEGRTVAPATL